jgi:hypothetical protein
MQETEENPELKQFNRTPDRDTNSEPETGELLPRLRYSVMEQSLCSEQASEHKF